jgi:hypothetical protein
VALALLALVVLGPAAPVVWLTIDETAVPPASDAPPLPQGVTATYQGVSCASGGCWREWTVSGPRSWSGTELADRLDMPTERCATRSLLDRREVCTSLELINGQAHLFVQFTRPRVG